MCGGWLASSSAGVPTTGSPPEPGVFPPKIIENIHVIPNNLQDNVDYSSRYIKRI